MTLTDARFQTFWDAYPRKVAKKAAEKAFLKIDPDHGLLTRMLDAIAVQRVSRQWREGYIPHPATWLHQERWTDEVAVTVTTPTSDPSRGWQTHCPHRPPCVLMTQCPEAWAWVKAQLNASAWP